MRGFRLNTRVLVAAVVSLIALPALALVPPVGSIWNPFRERNGVALGELSDHLQLKWTFKTGGAVKSSAVIGWFDGKRHAFIGSGDGCVYCLDLETGKEVWTFKTQDAVEAPPTLAGDRLLVGSVDAHLYCLDVMTGKLIWKFETGDKIIGAAAVAPGGPSGNLVLVGSYDCVLYALDLATGKPVWKYEMTNPLNGAPAVNGGAGRAPSGVVFGGCDGMIHVVSIETGKSLKEIATGSMIGATVALADHVGYVGNMGNEVVAADLDKGQILWRFKGPPFGYYSSAAVTDKLVIVGGRDKRLHGLNRSDGKEVWHLQTRGAVDSSPVIVGDRVVVGSNDGRVYMADLATGKQIWRYELGRHVSSSPAVSRGTVVIGCEDGSVYAFGSPGE